MDEDGDYSRWNSYAQADPVNRLILTLTLLGGWALITITL